MFNVAIHNFYFAVHCYRCQVCQGCLSCDLPAEVEKGLPVEDETVEQRKYDHYQISHGFLAAA